jgi:hypothetical protein
VAHGSALDRLEGEAVEHRGPQDAESWSASAAMAKSFAMSPSWHADDMLPVGIVVKLASGSIPSEDVLLSPPSKTARWFERAVKNELASKTVEDRATEREYLLVARSRWAVIEHRGEIQYPKAAP